MLNSDGQPVETLSTLVTNSVALAPLSSAAMSPGPLMSGPANVLEQDHRAIKRRVKAKQSFREFQAAWRTIEGYEAMHMIRKGQVRRVRGADVRRQNQFIDQLFDLAA